MASTLTACGNGCGRAVRTLEGGDPTQMPWCNACLEGDPTGDPLGQVLGEGGPAALLQETDGDVVRAVRLATVRFRKVTDRPTPEKVADFVALVQPLLIETAAAAAAAAAEAEAAASTTTTTRSK